MAPDLRSDDWDLEFHPQLRLVRYSAKPHRLAQGIGRWTDDDGRPLYGLAPIGYIPVERVKKMESLADYEAAMAALEAAKQPPAAAPEAAPAKKAAPPKG